MHEFSLALEVVALAQRELDKHQSKVIREMTIEVGNLSGVEADAFESALNLLVKNSILEEARIQIDRTFGRGQCLSCHSEFTMSHRLDACPDCHCFPSEIKGGDEFRVISLVVEG